MVRVAGVRRVLASRCVSCERRRSRNARRPAGSRWRQNESFSANERSSSAASSVRSSRNSCSPGAVTRYALRVRRPGRGAAPDAGRGEVAVERTGRDVAAAAVVDGFRLLDRAGPLQPPQRRVQRAERDAPERAERLGQALLQLVAVQRLLGEQSENGELQHGIELHEGGTGATRYIESIYRASTWQLAAGWPTISDDRLGCEWSYDYPATSDRSREHRPRVGLGWPPVRVGSSVATSATDASTGVARWLVHGEATPLVSSQPSTLDAPRVPSVTDYALARRAVLRDFRSGALTRLDVCDAHPELMRAAQNIGVEHPRPVPGVRRVEPAARVVRLRRQAEAGQRPGHQRHVGAPEAGRLVRRVRLLRRRGLPRLPWNHLRRQSLHGRLHAS